MIIMNYDYNFILFNIFQFFTIGTVYEIVNYYVKILEFRIKKLSVLLKDCFR